MKKLLVFLGVSLLLGIFGYNAFFWYHDYQREKAYEEFMANATNTASERVTVLRDSISIGYQKDKRTIHVYLPPGYQEQDSIHYPVIYLMDGSGAFNELENGAEEWQVDEVIDSIAANGGQGAIVIGIESAENRDEEYTPWPIDDYPDAHGERYMNWFCQEFKPWVDAHFRTLSTPEYTTIGGISRSGMMAYYAIMSHPETFGQALIQSPSMWVDEANLLEMEPAGNMEDKRVFVSVGELEAPMVPLAQKTYDRLAAAGVKPENRKMTVYQGLGHWHLTWRKSFKEAFPWLIDQSGSGLHLSTELRTD